jgi:glucose-6-phosphate 1-dehydrogenase
MTKSTKPTTTVTSKGFPAVQDRFKIAPESMATIVIFGATGDLAGRKLIPAIYNLWVAGFLPPKIAVVGVGRKNLGDNTFRENMCEMLKKHSRTGHGTDDSCDPFVGSLHYRSLEFNDAAGFARLATDLTALETKLGSPGHRLYYLATSPEFFAKIVEGLGAAGMVRNEGDSIWSRVVIEKPFGNDLASAKALNQEITQVLAENQIYRIDHYLGKETVQNIFAFRFGNAIFEPLFNQKYVDNVQVTVAETVGMEGRRGEFYDKTGALRDVVQNHALQLMCIVAMEPPAAFGPKEIRDEKTKVLTSVVVPKEDPIESWICRGQYTEGSQIKGYLSEEGVPPESTTETFVALRLRIDNWRWAGVPFLLRTGKRMKSRVTEIAIQFKHPPTKFFEKLGCKSPETNVLVFRIQPDEAISLTFTAKTPGMEFDLLPVTMDFHYGQVFDTNLPDAYERLLLDALRGDASLFTRADEIEYAWRIVTETMEAWHGDAPPELYRPGSWGPSVASRLLAGVGGEWRQPAV